MPKDHLETVRAVALGLPEAYEQPSYGDRPSWRTKPRVFAWSREAPEALVVWVSSVEEKDAMVAAEPHLFTTPHYDGLPIILVDLDAVDHNELTELIAESWRLRAPRLCRRRFSMPTAPPEGHAHGHRSPSRPRRPRR